MSIPGKEIFPFPENFHRKHPRAVLRGAGVLVSSKSDCSVRKFVITGRMLRGRHRLAFPHEHRIQRLTVLVDHFISACSGTNVPAVQWIVHIFYLRGRQTCDHCQYAHPSALYAPRLNLPPTGGRTIRPPPEPENRRSALRHPGSGGLYICSYTA